MQTSLPWLAAILLAAGLSVAAAAPNVPSSELPGRQRERFTPSPLDPLMQPRRPVEPLWRGDCDGRPKQRRSPRSRDC
jgi:hypothetical protein